MPVFGNNKANKVYNYEHSSMAPYAKKFLKVANDVKRDSYMDIFTESSNILRREDAYQAIKDFFINECYDPEHSELGEKEDNMAMMEQLFENDRSALLENAALNTFNPVIGMSYPMHKYLLMSNVFDNNGITKAVSNTPKFTITMEKRFLVTPEGKEIDLFYDQSAIKDAIDGTLPWKQIEMTLPEIQTTDVLTLIGGNRGVDAIGVETYISAIKAEVITTAAVLDVSGNVTTPAVTEDKWIEVNYTFKPGYGDGEKRTLSEAITITSDVEPTAKDVTSDFLTGLMYKDSFTISSAGGKIKAVRLAARKDSSNAMMDTCKVKWSTDESLVEIGGAPAINIPVSPDEIKDVQALYGISQLSQMMSMIKDVLGNWKDDSVKENLDNSYRTLSSRQKFSQEINFAVTGGYLTDSPATWRHDIFMDHLNTLATKMIQVWNDPNVEITVIGRTDLIRKIIPTSYAWQSPDQIGGVQLDFNKTCFTSDNRRFQFISTDKIRSGGTGAWNSADEDDLIVLLKPRNTDRIMYVVYDYQLYIANDIRNAVNPTLPAVHAFDRWKFYEYQPVQSRVTILNPMGF